MKALLVVLAAFAVALSPTEPRESYSAEELAELSTAHWLELNAAVVVRDGECHDWDWCDNYAGHLMYDAPEVLEGWVTHHPCQPPMNHYGPILCGWGMEDVEDVLAMTQGDAIDLARSETSNLRLSPDGEGIDLLNCGLDQIIARIPLWALE